MDDPIHIDVSEYDGLDTLSVENIVAGDYECNVSVDAYVKCRDYS